MVRVYHCRGADASAAAREKAGPATLDTRLSRSCICDQAWRLSGYFPPEWIETLQSLASGKLVQVKSAKDPDTTMSASEVAEHSRKVLEQLPSLQFKNLLPPDQLQLFSSELEKHLSSDALKSALSEQANSAENFAKLLTAKSCAALIQRDLLFPRMHEEFQWMKD